MITVKEFAYKPAVANFDWGKIKVKLVGAGTQKDGEYISGSPYELLIWYKVSEQGSKEVVLESLSLHEKPNDLLAFSAAVNMPGQFELFSDGTYNALFRFESLHLKYVEYVLTIQLRVGEKGDLVQKKVTVSIEKDYKEYKINPTWEKILSV